MKAVYNLIIAMSLFLLLFLMISCPAPEPSGPGEHRTFWAVDANFDYINSSTGWYQLDATLVKTGTNCLIYLEDGQSVSQTNIDDLTDEFDNGIRNTVITYFANPTDIDDNGKIILLLLDIRDSYNPPSVTSYIGGYFYGVDLLTNAELDYLGYPSYFKSNEGELLYIDINPNNPTTTDFKSTVVHEFQHLVNMSRNIIQENNYGLPTWINEGFSMAAEAIYQGVPLLSAREDWYDLDPLYTGSYGVTPDPGSSITYGFPFVLWNPYPSNPNSVLNNYALSHLFFAWLQIHMGTNTFYKTINQQTDNTVQAVIDICSGTIGSEVNTFDKMLGRWWMANLLGGNGNDSGLESYLGLNTHTGPIPFIGAGGTVDLYASGALHFQNTAYDAWSPVGGDTQIRYELGDLGAGTADYSEPFGTGDDTSECMIVYNNEYEGTTARTSAILPAITNPSDLKSAKNKRSLSSVIPDSSVFRKGLEPKDLDLPPLNQ